MLGRKARGLVTVWSMALVLLSAPAESYAFFDWLCPCNWFRGRAATTYAPPYSGRPVALAPRYAAPTTCAYVPMTCYRTEYRFVPVTTCQAVTCQDPCSGCPMVTYRPVTSMALQPQLVPYTTYRIVYTSAAPCAPVAPACGCGPAVSYGAASPGCSSCVSPAPVATMLAPPVSPLAVNGASPATVSSASPVIMGPPVPVSPAPTVTSPITTPGVMAAPALPLNSPVTAPAPNGSSSTVSRPTWPSSSPSGISAPASPPNTAPGPLPVGPGPGSIKTFENGTPPSTQERLKPIPAAPDSNTGLPPAKMPEAVPAQGRTAQRLIRQAVYVQPVSDSSPSGSPIRPQVDTSGWEAAGE